ncbi:biopolymer transporter ExbD [Psychromarinibacter sp. C21-152]|uniref:Biopolymer transporter ExbD n=1 Tax=Psychromarinibacter sediminicola TaxID=3033385 RepID=A0AAE3NX44_9RHOB|nr:biopolymer transporter ExbD [Psychromarinibacter sediminicola]MDF0603284.1 biopolymer transporter ExbD [Psychromarinibacter sediminicola]
MALRLPRQKPRGEPTIALINIVFLMLIFFMIAGALAPPLDGDVSLVDTAGLDGRAPPDAPAILPDGTLRYRDAVTTPADVVARVGGPAPSVRVVPDRELPAQELLRVARALREAGAGEVWLVTEKGLE